MAAPGSMATLATSNLWLAETIRRENLPSPPEHLLSGCVHAGISLSFLSSAVKIELCSFVSRSRASLLDSITSRFAEKRVNNGSFPGVLRAFRALGVGEISDAPTRPPGP